MFPSDLFPHLDDPFVAVFVGVLTIGLMLWTPAFLFVLIVVHFGRRDPQHLYTPADIARLVRREARRRASQARRAVVIPMPAVPPALPLTPAQQARYDDMRAKGWSELASQQAAARLPA